MHGRAHKHRARLRENEKTCAGWQQLERLAAKELLQDRPTQKIFVDAARKLSVGKALTEQALGHWYNEFRDGGQLKNQWLDESSADAAAQQMLLNRKENNEKKKNKLKLLHK